MSAHRIKYPDAGMCLRACACAYIWIHDEQYVHRYARANSDSRRAEIPHSLPLPVVFCVGIVCHELTLSKKNKQQAARHQMRKQPGRRARCMRMQHAATRPRPHPRHKCKRMKAVSTSSLSTTHRTKLTPHLMVIRICTEPPPPSHSAPPHTTSRPDSSI
jgi:hypothetical protein